MCTHYDGYFSGSAQRNGSEPLIDPLPSFLKQRDVLRLDVSFSEMQFHFLRKLYLCFFSPDAIKVS